MNRRHFLRFGLLTAGTLPSLDSHFAAKAEPVANLTNPSLTPPAHPTLTPALKFVDVSRGNPKPYTLEGAALEQARLTPETWRCEITAAPFTEEPHTKYAASIAQPLPLKNGKALDLPALMDPGKQHELHFLKAMQCLNIDTPLGQGVWSGVPLSEVLKLCGKMENVRRICFWGFHNQDPKQLFKSSVSYTQCMETPPGELPVFLAYRLNTNAIPLLRGGPVRMVVPWSHGYKSIKWLQHISLTNDARISDTYATGNNDPDSFLKTAAYLDKTSEPLKFKEGAPIVLRGQVISGLSGLKRVEFWVRRVDEHTHTLADDAPELLAAPWAPCTLEPEPDWSRTLPQFIRPGDLRGFNQTTGRMTTWPPRYAMCSYFASLENLPPGLYEVRARAIDGNNIAQPEPRPSQKSGKNAIQVRRIEVKS